MNIKQDIAFSLSVSPSVVKQIKSIVEEGVCEPIVDSSGGTSTTTIIELGFLNDLARTNVNKQEELMHLWQILADFNVQLLELKACNPDFLVLYACEDNPLGSDFPQRK